MEGKRIGILIVAYNAASTLVSVLDRIPASFRPRIAEVVISDDHSSDATYFVGLGYKQVVSDIPITVIRHERNLGYGGNQKAGYRRAIERDLDVVVLLHGDGQYAPECLADIVAPLESGEADAVFGSRMLEPGRARDGKMPLYKLVGNRVLTRIENAMLGTNLSEFHSGYRAYSVDALRQIDFEANSDGFDFDTEIIIQLHHKRLRIAEVPIPTYYGDEICYVNGFKYAADVVADVTRYRLAQMGLSIASGGSPDATRPGSSRYPLKQSPSSSHGRIVRMLSDRPPMRILDLGCADGFLAEGVRAVGHHVTGVDVEDSDSVRSRVDRFVAADLEAGIPAQAGGPFDVVIAADVVEHVRDPVSLLREARSLLGTGGRVLVTIPNFVHWYSRFRVATGTFDYDDWGILDRTHLRFFTRRSFARVAQEAGLVVGGVESIGLPLERLIRSRGRVWKAAEAGNAVTVALRPSLFAYQYLFELWPAPDPQEAASAAPRPAGSAPASSEGGRPPDPGRVAATG